MSVKLFTVEDACPALSLPYVVLGKDFIEAAGFAVGRKFIAEIKEKGEIILKLVDEE